MSSSLACRLGIGWLGDGESSNASRCWSTKRSRAGKISAPISLTATISTWSAALPHRETENMKDGSDAIADWPILNALLNCSSGADLVVNHGLACSRGVSAGSPSLLDGNPATAERPGRVLDWRSRHRRAPRGCRIRYRRGTGQAVRPVGHRAAGPSFLGSTA